MAERLNRRDEGARIGGLKREFWESIRARSLQATIATGKIFERTKPNEKVRNSFKIGGKRAARVSRKKQRPYIQERLPQAAILPRSAGIEGIG